MRIGGRKDGMRREREKKLGSEIPAEEEPREKERR